MESSSQGEENKMPKITHFEIIGTDGKKSREFYSGLFGWEIDANNPMEYGLVAPTENGIGGGIAGAQPGGQPMVTIYVEVDAIQPYLDKVVSLGGKVLMERTVLPAMVTMAQFQDPDGNVIGLTESEIPPA
jgi:predicted enzyme related to lactoylglutathione lyase